MTNTNKQWPLYDSHKQVRALRIKALSDPTLNEINIKIVTASFYEEGFPDLELLPIFMDKFNPEVGGYLVQYMGPDGQIEHTSFSPFTAFQSYTPADAADPTMAVLAAQFARCRPEFVRNQLIAHMIGKIFFYGDFKVETFAEKELDHLLVQAGFRYTSEEEVLAGVAKYEEQPRAQMLLSTPHGSTVDPIAAEEGTDVLREHADTTLFTNTLDKILPWESAGQPLRNVTDVGFLRGAVIHLWSLLDQISKFSGQREGSVINDILKQRHQHLASDGKELVVVQK